MEDLIWLFISFWANSSMIHLMATMTISCRVMLCERNYPGVGEYGTHPEWTVSHFFKLVGLCFTPIMGTVMMICGLRMWFLNQEDFLIELEKQRLFKYFRSQVTYELVIKRNDVV